MLGKRQEEVLLRSEVRVDGPLGVPGRLGDRLQRRPVIAEPVEDVGGGGEEAFARLGAALVALQPPGIMILTGIDIPASIHILGGI
jgi:hypothetical protein